MKEFLRAWVSGNLDFTEEKLGKSMACFPLVGLFIGLILVTVRIAFSYLLPSSLVDILVIITLVVVAGSFHLDGFADTIDGLAGGTDRKRTLAIMKDSRIGSFAVTGLILLLILKVFALIEVPVEIKNRTLLIMPVLGRWSTVQLASFFDYARSGPGTALAFTQFAGKKEYFISTLVTVVIVAGLFLLQGLLILVAVAAFIFLFGLFFKRRIGGVTGDIMGAGCELGEVITLLLICVLFKS